MLSRKLSLPSLCVWKLYLTCGVSSCNGYFRNNSPDRGPSHDCTYSTTGGRSGSSKRLRLLHSNSSLPDCVCKPLRNSTEKSDGSGCGSGTSFLRPSQNQRKDTGARRCSFSVGTTKYPRRMNFFHDITL